jgi:hypothetical protein
MTHDTGWTGQVDWARHLCCLRTVVQPYITAVLAYVDGHACPMPPEDEAEVMHAIKEAAWR